MDKILSMENMSKSFGGNRALKNVSFSCEKGTVHVVAGENGAGKSTILKILAGVYPADGGEIYLNGEKVKITNPAEAQKQGIAMVFQELTLIGDLTVEENLFLNMEPVKGLLLDKKEITRRCKELMDEYDIKLNPKSIAGRLSVAEQQMAEILKILLREPEIIILDEPTSSLAKKEVEKLFAIVKNLIKNGKTIIFISHRLDEVFELGDDVTVLKDGELIGTEKLADIDRDHLIRMMVGRPLEDLFPPKAETISDEVIFEAKNLVAPGVLEDISFQLRKGEIIGVAGLQGHGQVELLNALSGLHPLKSGTFSLFGKQIKIPNAKRAIKNGIALVPSDRKLEGLALVLPILQNLALCSLNKRSRFGFLNLKKEKEFAERSKGELSIKAYKLSNPAWSLSGGNQQKVVLGKELGIEPRLMLFSDPTRGIDIESKGDFYRIMRRLANEGVGVIVCSSEMMEAIGMCDRVLVMYEGAITAVLEGDMINEEKIMRCAMGILDD